MGTSFWLALMSLFKCFSLEKPKSMILCTQWQDSSVVDAAIVVYMQLAIHWVAQWMQYKC